MSRVTRTLIALVAVVLNLSIVLAQDEEALLRYETALANLQQSVEMLPTDAGASLDALARADAALRRLSQDTASSSLIEAMDRVFENARVAVQNRSSTDLEVQTSVLRGGFQRGLLEASLDSGEPDGALPGIRRLAGDLGLDVRTHEAIAEAPDMSSLLHHYQSGVARSIAERIGVAAEQFDGSLETSYVTLARAYGMFLSLQDSPQAPADLNDDFLALVNALVSSDSATVAEQSADLSETFTQLADALVGAAASAPAQPEDTEPATEPETPTPAVEDPADTEPAAADETELATTAPADEPPATAPAAEQGDVPAEAVPDAEADTEAASDLPALGQQPEPEVDTEAIREQVRQQEIEQRISAVMSELARRGLRGQPAEAVARQLTDRGFGSLSDAIDGNYALVARFADAIARGAQPEARSHLDALAGQFSSSLAPILARTAPQTLSETEAMISSLRAAPTLRQTDARAMLEQISAADASLAGVAPDMLSRVQAGTTQYFGGWPRMIVIILLALFSILPLVLLRIAFGTGNRNWSLIGTGLFLLLLPLMLDGLGQLAGLVSSFANLPLLDQAASWLALETPLGEALWLLLMLLAILLLSIGLYGICRQFGLFGGSETGKRASRKQKAEPETKTLVDWDEEF